MALRALCLCDGYGGFELGLRQHGIRTVARVERDSHAAAVLVARMETQELDQAPVWDDLTTFDGTAWRGRVDIVTAGFPCQPFSQAGQRRGVDDERWLWPDIARIVADVGPRYVFLENVPGLVRHGLPHVCADLADLGFDAEWGLYAASAVGAPHRRERFWLLARLGESDGGGLTGSARERMAWHTHRSIPNVADTDSPGGTRLPVGTGQELAKLGSGSEPSNVADTPRVDEREPHHQASTHTRHHPRHDTRWRGFPPRPDDTDGWHQWTDQGRPQPSIRRSTHGAPRPVDGADRLHLLGNGLVPQAAAEAFRQLAERLTGR